MECMYDASYRPPLRTIFLDFSISFNHEEESAASESAYAQIDWKSTIAAHPAPEGL
jgi:hypothetical protein